MYVQSDEIDRLGYLLYLSGSYEVVGMICHALSLDASGDILMSQRVEDRRDKKWRFILAVNRTRYLQSTSICYIIVSRTKCKMQEL